jgi:putative DNA methylase
MIDDPSSHPELFKTEGEREQERERLFNIMRRLVLWESTTDEGVLAEARHEILNSWRATCAENAGDARAKEIFDPSKLPVFCDPFAGGGGASIGGAAARFRGLRLRLESGGRSDQ